MIKINDRIMKTAFDEFINEQYRLTIEDSMDDFDVQEEAPWAFTYDVSNVWKRYNQTKDDDKFLNEYKNLLLSKKDVLINISKGCWNDLVEIVNEKKSSVLPYLDKVYDWADKYGIKINT
jgi:hypothetical protein